MHALTSARRSTVWARGASDDGSQADLDGGSQPPAAAQPLKEGTHPMPSNPRYANGHRRRTLRARHLATASRHTCPWPACPWPDEPFDPTLEPLDPKAPEVDEILPISRGGDPYSWTNTQLMHRECNQRKGNRLETEAATSRTAQPNPVTSRTW